MFSPYRGRLSLRRAFTGNSSGGSVAMNIEHSDAHHTPRSPSCYGNFPQGGRSEYHPLREDILRIKRTMLKRLIVPIAFALSLAASNLSAADSPRAINWENLAPDLPEILDPFTHLTPEQRLDLFAIYGIREQSDQDFTSRNSPSYQLSIELTDKLTETGLDVEALLGEAREVEKKIIAQAAQTVPELEGQLVEMPGFALPLEFSDKGVTEFLLVPYLGACIHTPPPPPNQMVFVQLQEPFKLDDIYTPVLITGHMKIAATTKKLFFVDGQADIDTGYSLRATKIELDRQ